MLYFSSGMWSNLKSAICSSVFNKRKISLFREPDVRQTHFFIVLRTEKHSLPASRIIWLVKIAWRRRWWQWGSGEAVTPQSTLQDAFSHWDAHPLTLIHHQCIETIPEAFSLFHSLWKWLPSFDITAVICKNITAAAETFVCTEMCEHICA